MRQENNPTRASANLQTISLFNKLQRGTILGFGSRASKLQRCLVLNAFTAMIQRF